MWSVGPRKTYRDYEPNKMSLRKYEHGEKKKKRKSSGLHRARENVENFNPGKFQIKAAWEINLRNYVEVVTGGKFQSLMFCWGFPGLYFPRKTLRMRCTDQGKHVLRMRCVQLGPRKSSSRYLARPPTKIYPAIPLSSVSMHFVTITPG